MDSGSKAAPYGKRLIPRIIDETASQHPDREVFQIPVSSNPQDGWKIVTWKQYANAVNHVAHRIIETCGEPNPGSFPTIAYIGPNDARYVVIMVAAIKAGYKALFVSPRNSQEAQINLFDKTDCHILVFPETHYKLVQPWIQERPDMRAIDVGGIPSWFPENDVPHFPYTKSFEEAEWDPVVVLHTSGSTGLPKPIIAQVGMLSIGDAYHDLPAWQGRHTVLAKWLSESKRQWVPMPLFHAAGLYTFIISLYWDTPVVFGVERPLSSDLVVECLKNLDVEAAFLPPVILEDMSQEANYMSQLKKLKFTLFGGGNLAREAGNRLVENGVTIVNVIAATEATPFPYYYQEDPKLWQYFIINSELFGVDWRQTAEEGVYEQVIVRKAKDPGLQGFFYTFPRDKEYFTKDLYKAHPSLPDHWIYQGRADNIIVFSNGEKLNPVTIEEIVDDHPQVTGAVVFGSNKFQPGILIEPLSHPKNKVEEQAFLDKVWPLIVQANKETVAHGQIGRDYILLTNPDKPLPRAGKGTVQRPGAIKIYQNEIDQLYESANSMSGQDAPRLDISSEDALVNSICKMFEVQLGSSQLGEDADFFSAGIDSMQVISASRLLRAGLEAAGCHTDSTTLATRVIYGNPTPRGLARHLMREISQGSEGDGLDGGLEQQLTMQHLYEKYTRDFREPAQAERPEPADEGQVVVLTGSTGMLGSYLLDQMICSPRVRKVICLNRADDGGVQQQAKAMTSRGLSDQYTTKAEFYHIDISRSDFALSKNVYKRLLEETDRWIHNAWPVNFNITVETFEPHIRGVRNVADFAVRASKRLAVVFISSIGTADAWGIQGHTGPVPEQRLEDMTLPTGGYGQSKMIASMALEDAARAGGFHAATLRMGQIAGPQAEAGAWNRHEWLPSIIASSLFLKALPRDLGLMNDVDWTPVEICASLVLEIAGVTRAVRPEDLNGYYHGVNPSHTTWQALAPAVQEFYGEDRLPKLVSFDEWVQMLETSQSDAAAVKDLDLNPGIKLLDTYQGMAAAARAGEKTVKFDMQRTVTVSPSMKNAKVVDADLMKLWCKQWGF